MKAEVNIWSSPYDRETWLRALVIYDTSYRTYEKTRREQTKETFN